MRARKEKRWTGRICSSYEGNEREKYEMEAYVPATRAMKEKKMKRKHIFRPRGQWKRKRNEKETYIPATRAMKEKKGWEGSISCSPEGNEGEKDEKETYVPAPRTRKEKKMKRKHMFQPWGQWRRKRGKGNICSSPEGNERGKDEKEVYLPATRAMKMKKLKKSHIFQPQGPPQWQRKRWIGVMCSSNEGNHREKGEKEKGWQYPKEQSTNFISGCSSTITWPKTILWLPHSPLVCKIWNNGGQTITYAVSQTLLWYSKTGTGTNRCLLSVI